MSKIPDGFDAAAGHIAIAHRTMPVSDIDWALIACNIDQTWDDIIVKNHLTGIEGRPKGVSFDFYIMEGDLRLHVDDTLLQENGLTLGLIIEADPDLRLTTGRNDIPAKAGDVFLLDPMRQHGAKTEGFLAFVTFDYHRSYLPSVDSFYNEAISQLRTLVRHHRAHHHDADSPARAAA